MSESKETGLNILAVGGLVPWHPRAGGGQVTAYKLSEALVRAGHNLHYLAVAPEEFRRKIDWGNISYIPETKGNLTPVLEAYCAIGEHRVKYDIIHIHTSGERVSRAFRKKLTGATKLVVAVYAPGVHRIPWLRSPGEFIDFFNCHTADLILCPSNFSRENIARSFYIPPRKIGVMYGGVDETFFAFGKRYPSEKDHFTLLFCGRLNGPHQQKGVDILLRALPLILPRHPVTLEIVGTGPRERQYKRMVGELGIEDHVKFLGFIPAAELVLAYARADLFVLPTRRESFGLTLVEAMAAGLPVVSTNVTAVPEVVIDGETGLLVPPGDPVRLAQAVNTLLGQPAKMRLMGQKGQARVKELFTWEKVARNVINYYREILSP